MRLTFSSSVDSGYSVDNIRPRRPRSLTGQIQAASVDLQWEDNTDPDIEGYRLYRGPSADFTPDESNRIAARSCGATDSASTRSMRCACRDSAPQGAQISNGSVTLDNNRETTYFIHR